MVMTKSEMNKQVLNIRGGARRRMIKKYSKKSSKWWIPPMVGRTLQLESSSLLE